MGRAGLARVGVSVTTLNTDLARKMEPRVPSPARRLRAIEVLSKMGCPVRVMVSPIVPGLTDHEIEAVLQAAHDAGAVAATSIALRLPREVAPLWRDWLAEHYPARINRVMRKIRHMHGGRDYDPRWGHRMRGEGEYARMIGSRVKAACKRLGLKERTEPLRSDLFAKPAQQGDQLGEQLRGKRSSALPHEGAPPRGDQPATGNPASRSISSGAFSGVKVLRPPKLATRAGRAPVIIW